MDNKYILYILLIISFLLFFISFLTLNALIILINMFIILFSISLYYFNDIIIDLIFKHSNIIEIFNGYELSGSRNVAVFRNNGSIGAIAAALINTENIDELDKAKIEHLIGGTHYPFKLVLYVENLDIKKIIDKLQTRKSIKEIELTRIDIKDNKNIIKANKIKKEIENIESDIRNISDGEVPIKISYYVMTTAIADTLLEASERANTQIKEITAKIDAFLSSHSTILTGNDLINVLKLDAGAIV
ncbi:MAG: hypothetical protein ACP5UN_00820 [Candidatus Micrarchaeia archaeon]